MGDATLGRATYQRSWRWTLRLGRVIDARFGIANLGYVVMGCGATAIDDGRNLELTARSLFCVPAIPHDSWVIGNEPYVSLHLLSESHYAVRS